MEYRVKKTGNRYIIQHKILFIWSHCSIRTIEGSFYDQGQQMPILAIEKSWIYFSTKEQAKEVLERRKNYLLEVYKGERLERVFGNNFVDVVINKHRTGSEAMFFGYFHTNTLEQMHRIIDGERDYSNW